MTASTELFNISVHHTIDGNNQIGTWTIEKNGYEFPFLNNGTCVRVKTIDGMTLVINNVYFIQVEPISSVQPQSHSYDNRIQK